MSQLEAFKRLVTLTINSPEGIEDTDLASDCWEKMDEQSKTTANAVAAEINRLEDAE